MKRVLCLVVQLLTGVSLSVGQSDIWVNNEKGSALFLNPKTMAWEPIVGKQQLPAKTYVLTKDQAVLKIFKETDVLSTPAGGYFFIADIFSRDRMQVVEELTAIEAQQLPPSSRPDTMDGKKVVGLTYGAMSTHASSRPSIPYLEERINAVESFQAQKRYDAALLSLKRTMSLFPALYLESRYADLLCRLYDSLELYGFLYEETNRLMVVQRQGEFGTMIAQWNELAKKKLTKR
jgi:hypothetical protein